MGVASKAHSRPTGPGRGKAAALLAIALGGSAGLSCRRAPQPAPPPAAAPTPNAADEAPPPRGAHIAILYASDQRGAYTTCGCAVHPMGGIARRATVVDRARAEADTVLVLDAGNLLSPAPPEHGKPPDAGELARRARLLAAAWKRIGTDALAPAERDLALGLPLLRRIAKQFALPLVSANLRGPDGELLFARDRLVRAAGGVQIGLFGVTAPSSPSVRAAWRAAGIEAGDPLAAARAEVASLRARGAGLVIALTAVGPAAEARKLLAATPGIDWAVVGQTTLHLESPERAGDGARMLAVMAEGKELGRLDLHVVAGSLAFADRGERAEVETILADQRRQLVDYDHRLGETDPAQLRDYYESRRHQIEAAIARESAALARLPPRITGSWFENRLLPLDAETPDQPGVAMLVDAYRRETARRAAARLPAGLGDEAPPGAGAGRPGP